MSALNGKVPSDNRNELLLSTQETQNEFITLRIRKNWFTYSCLAIIMIMIFAVVMYGLLGSIFLRFSKFQNQVRSGPKEETICEGCHSCTFKGCCDAKFTDPYTACPIPGWHSEEYIKIHSQ